MRGRISSKQRSVGKGGESMELVKVDEAKEDTHISDVYIHSLVKQLTTSRAKDQLDGDGGNNLKTALTKTGECCGDGTEQSQQPPVQPPQHKKQVRRRLHTSRPYQERLLNMAEARREIVTALKFHRASMKKQLEATNLQSNHSQNHALKLQPPPQSSLVQGVKSKSRRNTRIYASNATSAAATTNFSGGCLDSFAGLSCPPPIPYFWPVSAVVVPPLLPPPLAVENLNLALPNQPLGLNLNFQGFNLDTPLYHNPLSIYSSSLFSSSSPSTSSSPALSVAATEEVVADNSAAGGLSQAMDNATGRLHQAMDNEEMEELRSIGEKHQMEWNDKLNMFTSARWFKFLKEIGSEEEKDAACAEDEDGYHPFDQIMEFPPWLVSANENFGFQQHLDDNFSDDYLQDPALPCMDIGEIEGMEGEWLA